MFNDSIVDSTDHNVLNLKTTRNLTSCGAAIAPRQLTCFRVTFLRPVIQVQDPIAKQELSLVTCLEAPSLKEERGWRPQDHTPPHSCMCNISFGSTWWGFILRSAAFTVLCIMWAKNMNTLDVRSEILWCLLNIVPIETRGTMLLDWAEIDARVIPTACARVLESR